MTPTAPVDVMALPRSPPVALAGNRLEYRVTLSDVDRGVELDRSLVISQHPSETAEHAALRVLAFCLMSEEHLAFGPGLSDPDAPDLVAKDLTGKITTWIDVGSARLDKLLHVARHNGEAAVHVVFDDPSRRDALLAEVAALERLPQALAAVTVWLVPMPLVAALAVLPGRRHRFALTIVGDHMYLDVDGQTLDGPLDRTRLAATR